MTDGVTPPFPPPPGSADWNAPQWQNVPRIMPPGRWRFGDPSGPGTLDRFFQLLRATFGPSAALTLLLVGVPSFLLRLLNGRNSTAVFRPVWVWIHTGDFPRVFEVDPQPAPNPLVGPLSGAISFVLTPLLYVALLRLMLGTAAGETPDPRGALRGATSRLGPAVGVGACMVVWMLIPLLVLVIAFVALVEAHHWQLALATAAVGVILSYSVLAYSLAALVGQDLRTFRATSRSFALTRRNGMGSFLLVSTALGINLSLNFYVGTLGFSDAIWVWAGIAQMLLSALTIPPVGALIATCYIGGAGREGSADPSRLLSVMTANDRA